MYATPTMMTTTTTPLAASGAVTRRATRRGAVPMARARAPVALARGTSASSATTTTVARATTRVAIDRVKAMEQKKPRASVATRAAATRYVHTTRAHHSFIHRTGIIGWIGRMVEVIDD